jgi:hypothetical protein
MADPSAPYRSAAPTPPDPADAIFGLPTDAGRSLGDLIDPDDWRLYHLMRELSNDDRARVIAFAQLLVDLRRAQTKAEGGRRKAEGPM